MVEKNIGKKIEKVSDGIISIEDDLVELNEISS